MVKFDAFWFARFSSSDVFPKMVDSHCSRWAAVDDKACFVNFADMLGKHEQKYRPFPKNLVYFSPSGNLFRPMFQSSTMSLGALLSILPVTHIPYCITCQKNSEWSYDIFTHCFRVLLFHFLDACTIYSAHKCLMFVTVASLILSNLTCRKAAGRSVNS